MAEKKAAKKTKTGAAKAKAEDVRAETEPVKAGAEPAVNEAEARQREEIDELKALVRSLQQELADRRPQVVQVMADTERVVMRFQAEVADDNRTVFGPDGMYGMVTGKTGTITVPKSEWSRFYNESVRGMIDRRWLIVLSGMDEKDRAVYGCDYKEGELLDEMAFLKLLDMGRDLIAVFPALCPEHQAMVASRFITAFGAGDARAKDRELIVALNEMSKEPYRDAGKNEPRKKGLFWPIIEEMNAEDAR